MNAYAEDEISHSKAALSIDANFHIYAVGVVEVVEVVVVVVEAVDFVGVVEAVEVVDFDGDENIEKTETEIRSHHNCAVGLAEIEVQECYSH